LDNAITYAGKWVSCLERLPQSDELEKQRIDVRTTMGLYLIQLNYHAEAKEAIDPIIDAANKPDHKRRLGQIHLILGSYYFAVEENYSEARMILEKALKSAVEFQDPINYVLGSYYLGVTHGWHCEFEKSVECL
jgi:tetratricopeptide (TPR) repeat protein